MLRMMSLAGARSVAVCVAGVLAGSAWAQQTAVIPIGAASTAGDPSLANSIPLGDFNSGTYQVMYAAGQMAGVPAGSIITGIQLRLWNDATTSFPSAAKVLPKYEIRLAGSSLTPGTMSLTFATNMTSPVLVRSGTLSLAAGAYPGGPATGATPEGWGPFVPFSTAYVYGGGPLVIEFRTESSGTEGFYADSYSVPGQVSRMSGSPSTATTASFLQTNGMAVRLTFTPPTPDLAKGVTKVIVGEDFAGTNGGVGEGVLAWTSQYTQQQVAAANQFDTIGPGSDFVGMTWRLWNSLVAAWPSAIANFAQYDVQLSRSVNGPGALSTTVATNVGSDAVQVRAGALGFGIGVFAPKGAEVVSPFGPEIAFANMYHYRGGSLLSVIRHSGQGSGSAGLFDGISAGSSGLGYNTDVQGWQTASAAAAVTGSTSSYVTTRYSVDAGTSSPLNQLSPTPGNSGLTITPLYQTILSASELKYIPVGSVIDSLWLRQTASDTSGPSSDVTAADFEVSLSSATTQPAGMSTTAAANEGADKVLVHDGGLFVAANTMPAGSNGNYGKIVQFQKHFVYKGGPLCVTIRHTGLSAALGNPEAVKGTLATNRSIYSFTQGAASGSFLGAGHTGTATKLGYIPSVMTPNSMAAAPGNDPWILNGVSNYTVQLIIAASQLRTVDVGSAITGMSLRHSNTGDAAGFPAADVALPRFDVTLSPAVFPPLSASTTFASNIGPGAVQTRAGAMVVPAGAYSAVDPSVGYANNEWYVPFSRAYVYQGGDLCVTIRGQGVVSASGWLDGDSFLPNASGSAIYNYSSADAVSGSSYGQLGVRLAFTPRAFCPWDLNNDGVVEDADFIMFLSAYNILDCADPSMPQGCPSDFNFDRVVEDADFVLFLAAYNTLVCP